MRLFGFEITRAKAPLPAVKPPSGWDYNFGLPFWGTSSGTWPLIHEPFTGAWQRNQALAANTLLVFYAVYRCVTLISQDVSKMRLRLVERNAQTGIWREVERESPFWPVLIKPNRYQNRIQFFDEWMGSKLIHGNTYVLKTRDARGIVTQLAVLNPLRTRVKVGMDGQVYYSLQADDLAQIEESDILVPASEIIHDRYKPLYHPLCGISPILAAALSGGLGMKIQANSQQFFENQSRPGGIITHPEVIPDDVLMRLKLEWQANYTGSNAGRTAILSDGLKYEPLRETATDAQMVEQLEMSAQNVCTAFGVPPYMIGVGDPPNYNNIEALNQQYYSQCLQNLIETIELLMDEGLGLTQVSPKVYGTEFDLSDLLRMDSATKSKTWGDLVKSGIAAPNEARAQFELPPQEGGDTPYLQQQNYSLEALAKRDAKEDPFASAQTPPAPANDDEAGEENEPPPGETEDDADAPRAAAAAIAERVFKQAKWYGPRAPDT